MSKGFPPPPLPGLRAHPVSSSRILCNPQPHRRARLLCCAQTRGSPHHSRKSSPSRSESAAATQSHGLFCELSCPSSLPPGSTGSDRVFLLRLDTFAPWPALLPCSAMLPPHLPAVGD